MRHKNSMKRHFIKRIYERLGLNMTDEEYNSLCENCFYGRFKLIKRQTHDSIYNISYKNFSFDVVYNESFKKLVTILPNSIKFS